MSPAMLSCLCVTPAYGLASAPIFLLDCLRSIAPGQWALHVPLGKLYTERLVPIDNSVQQIIHRLRFFLSLS